MSSPSDYDSAPKVISMPANPNPAVLTATEELVQRRYGDMHEAFQVTSITPAQALMALRNRYRGRLALAAFGRFPEGYLLQHTVGGSLVEFLLLTPPDLVAIRQTSGTWTRERRVAALHGPAPYSSKFYEEYLRQAQLPPYFLAQHHLGMYSGNAEGTRLGLARRPAIPVPDDIGHLMPSAGESVLYPTLRIGNADRAFVIRGGLSEDQSIMLTTRFPALNAGNPEFEVVFIVGGYVYLRNIGEEANQGQPVPVAYVHEWEVQWQPIGPQQASYVDNTDGHLPLLNAPPAPGPAPNTVPEPSANEREEARNAAIAHGGVVNPDHEVQGVGHYEWMHPFDTQYAAGLGINQYEVTRQRQNGELGLDRTPFVVWYSSPEYLDPPTQPTGSGQWEFYTPRDRWHAHVNLGGATQRYSLPAYPTATAVWDLRQALRDTNDYAYTDEARLIWVPDVNNAADERQQPDRQSAQADDEAAQSMLELSTDKLLSANHPQSHSPSTEEGIDPTNGFPGSGIDQTGMDGKAQYQQAQIGDKLIVVDRSDPIQGQPENHLLWVRARSGWLHFETVPSMRNKSMNWNDYKMLEALKAWRRQNYLRGYFGPKRLEPRVDYTEEERDWIMELIRKYQGARLSSQTITREELARRFNARFSATRSVDGLGGLYSRMIKEYDEHGCRVAHVGRGVHRQRVSEVEEPNKKRKRTSEDGEDGQDPEDENQDAEHEEDDVK